MVEAAEQGVVARVTGQIMRYGLAGVAINLALYILYLVLTAIGLAPLLASTLVFVLGVPISLKVHGQFTFRAGPVGRGRALAFAGFYGVGYLVQIGMLAGLHHGLGLAHQLAQAVAIVTVAATLFVLQKTLVFRA